MKNTACFFMIFFFSMSSAYSYSNEMTHSATSVSTQNTQRSMYFKSSQLKNVVLDLGMVAALYAIGKKLPKDKRMHLWAGAITGRVASKWCNEVNPKILSRFRTKNGKRKFLCSLGAASVVGVAKEVRDKVSGKGNPELADAVITGAGGALAGLRYIL